MSKYKSPIGGSGKRTTNQFYRSGINSLLSRIEKIENQVFCCGDDGIPQNLVNLNGSDNGGVTVRLGNKDTGKIYMLNYAGSTAINIYLPNITADNLGTTYEFRVQGLNTGGYIIQTADGDDTTGDIFIGGFIGASETAGYANYIQADDNDAKLTLDSAEENGGGMVGSFIRVTAIKYDGAAHSHWFVEGVVASADANSTFAENFEDL